MDEQNFQQFMNDQKAALKEARKVFIKYLVFKGIEYAVIAGVTIAAVRIVEKLNEENNSEVISEEGEPL